LNSPGTSSFPLQLMWGPTAEKTSECAFKKKSQETECFNFIRVLVALNQTHLYVCGTYAFSPACTYIHLENFTLVSSGRGLFLDGKGQCPFDPQHTYTALLVGVWRKSKGLCPATAHLAVPPCRQEGRAGSTAVCAYSQEDVERVFEGKYKELNKESSRWTVYSGPDMNPRPGSCSMGSSPDKALTFMKDHFLMDGKVSPIQGQPLLVKSDVTYTRITVHETRGVSGILYRVMFLATAEGLLHKAVELPEGSHIVESIQLFAVPERVKNLLLAPGK
ncbi:SEM4A protein, partial [Leiothrix lutea]|nr:SEM4A protein [Leiothrix lutea]